jgi:hypothetical protein
MFLASQPFMVVNEICSIVFICLALFNGAFKKTLKYGSLMHSGVDVENTRRNLAFFYL